MIQKPCGSMIACGSGTFAIPMLMYIWLVLQVPIKVVLSGGARLRSVAAPPEDMPFDGPNVAQHATRIIQPYVKMSLEYHMI
jgi:hypothetical protein